VPTLTFAFTNSVQFWVVPANVATITVDAYGAQGSVLPSIVQDGFGLGGLGGYISVSNISASSFVGQTLFIYVGAGGAPNSAPGLGGGGECIGVCKDFAYNGVLNNFMNGGGATDLRTSLSDLSSR
jgi:hypothetical protein